MGETEKYENLVIGSGEAGKYLAWTFAKAGERTALVERRMIGGSCPNVACLPSKNVIHSAKVASLAARAEEFGLETTRVATNMAGVLQRKRKMVEDLVEVHLGRFKDSETELIMGDARFIGPRTVNVDLNEGGTRTIAGDRVFLSLGTHASIPAIPGLADARPMTHIEALELDRVPEHLVVLGGGYVGLELAQVFRRFGARVSVVEMGPQLAGREDGDVGEAILDLFTDDGIEVLLETEVRGVDGQSGTEMRISVKGSDDERVIEATDFLIAAGRTPNSQNIGLEHGGVQLDVRGFVKVNEFLETTAPNVWAVGDCAGSPQFTHAAFDDFRIVRDNILNRGHRSTRDRLIPYVMFTDPQLARVGLNESECRKQGIEYRLVKMPMAAVLRTRTISEPRGFIKMLLGAENDRILGLTVFGAEASEIMAVVQTAMLGNLPFTVLRDALFTHPTTAEGLTYLLADVVGL